MITVIFAEIHIRDDLDRNLYIQKKKHPTLRSLVMSTNVFYFIYQRESFLKMLDQFVLFVQFGLRSCHVEMINKTHTYKDMCLGMNILKHRHHNVSINTFYEIFCLSDYTYLFHEYEIFPLPDTPV